MSRKRQDVFPQILTVSTNVAPAVTDYVVQKFALPVSRVGTTRNKAQVVEILWVDHYPGIIDSGDNENAFVSYLTTTALHVTGDAVSFTSVSEDVGKPEVLALAYQKKVLTTSGSNEYTFPIRVDMTDGAGNGTLVAVSQMSYIYGNIGGTNEAQGTVKIAYRIVEVGITEFVGIVESQSSVVL